MSTPSLVPTADRAPSLASRVVTIHSSDLGEAAPAAASVSFALPCALRIPADGVILRPGDVTVRLVDGRAQIRLPVYSDKVFSIHNGTDWGIVVKPSWGDYEYLVRVPAGSGPVSLADLAPVRALHGRELAYAITGVGVSVREGAQAGGSAAYSNGQIDFTLTVPPFKPETVYPYIDATAEARADHYSQVVLDDVDSRLENVTTAFEVAQAQGFTGTVTEWLDSLVGAKGDRGQASTVPGPANVLSIGSVSTGAPGTAAGATITGTSPAQALSFTIPSGLQGDRGPAGNVQIDRPGQGQWDITPEPMDLAVEDVQGLAARLAAMEYESGWRDVSGLLTGGATGNVFLARKGTTVHLMIHNLTGPAGHLSFLPLPDGFRPTVISGANWRNGTVASDNGDTVRQLSVFSNSMRVLNMPASKQVGGYVTFIVPAPLPSIRPGTPA